MATNANDVPGSKEPQKEANPFEGFISEAFHGGEPIPDPKPADPPAAAAKPADPPAAAKPADPPTAKETAETGDEGAAQDGKPKKTAQERINEVTRARRDAERARDASNARIAELERQLAESRQAKPAEPKPGEKPKELVDPNAPKPDDFEYGELDSRFIAAVARYESKKEFDALRETEKKEREQAAEKTAGEKRSAQYETMIASGNKKHEDFFEKVVAGAEDGNWKLSNEMGEMLLESEVGADIAYHLASNPAEAEKLFNASPREQARMFGKLEVQFSVEQATAAAVDDGGKPAQPKVPKAPPPVTTARGAVGQFEASADTDDFAAFERKVMQG